jgi:hypothetical protein
VLSLSAATSGRRGAGTPTKPAQGNSRALRAVGERLARGKGRHTLWTLLRSRSERGVGGWCWVPTGCSPGTTPRTRPGDRTLDATAQRRATVWEGARERDSVAWNVVAGAGAPGRPPAGRRGLPPHAPASWQEAWVSGRSSARRRSAWRPDRSSGTPQSPWPSPSASAARNSRSHRSDSRRWPRSPPKMRRSEALRPHSKLCPCTSEVNETAHERSSMATAGTAWIHSAIRHPAREGCPVDRGVRHQPAATTAARELVPADVGLGVAVSLCRQVSPPRLVVARALRGRGPARTSCDRSGPPSCRSVGTSGEWNPHRRQRPGRSSAPGSPSLHPPAVFDLHTLCRLALDDHPDHGPRAEGGPHASVAERP